MKLTNEIFTRRTEAVIDKLTKISKYKSKDEKGNVKDYDMKIFFSMAKLKSEYDRTKKPFDIAETNLAFEYCDKDKKGMPILGPNKEFRFNQRREDFQNKHDELMDLEIVLRIEPIKIDLSVNKFLLENEIITPADVAVLFGMIEFCE